MKPTYEELVKKYIGLIYFFAKRWVYDREDTDDVVSETYKKALIRYDNFDYQTDNQLKSWLLTICRNTVIDNQRLKKPTVSLDETLEVADSQNDIEKWMDQEIANENVIKLKSAIGKLNETDYDIITMKYFEELTFKEIAEVLDITESKAKMRCYRALTKLKKLIKL
ncbi:MAG TPA: sigma-70 family RNA polymerase sigma factor [Candidatus Saccharimonadales bacterium]|nr:sigma-70 family RNA polymerase sigma factor [Candidatus Saccharimonadales bacterium]